MSSSNQRQFTDPFGNEWMISVEEVDGRSRYFQTVVTSDGKRQTQPTPMRRKFARLSRRRFQDFSDATLWYLADEMRPADKLSQMVKIAPDWIDDLYADGEVTPVEVNQHATDLWTPLLRAVEANKPQVVEALLKCGADPLRGSGHFPPTKPYDLARDELKLGVLWKMVANVAGHSLSLDILIDCRKVVHQAEKSGSIPAGEQSFLKRLVESLGERIDELSIGQAPLESSSTPSTKTPGSTRRKTLP